MNSWLLLLAAPLLLSFRPATLATCRGCVDQSASPSVTDLQATACDTCFTTARSVPFSGMCLPGGGSSCLGSPCTPYLEITNHCGEGNGGSVSGGIGGVRFGPLRFPTGADSVVYRGWSEVSCGSSSPYELTVDSGCGGQRVEFVSGTMTCDSCAPGHVGGQSGGVTPQPGD